MKYLFWLLLIALAWWAYTRSRQARPSDSQPSATAPQDMVRCAHCGIHLPLGDAVSGEKGLYCSTEHRSAAQDRNPV
ncbi:PP0621 family protein [Limnohabitans radicicola]|uniref:Deaminase n=1 Tax=Limnohabitans radicicola TaxID=2771427 RepID=A0A927FIY3_9BURK|nr:PP0621 family protein [Limnohabitans radicicola]MBD8051453.1 hypothetical protein [Limnohabitans radicicola]